MICVGYVAHTGVHREGKKPLGRPRCGEKVNAKVCRKKQGMKVVTGFN